jgi:hypothetical protein
MDRQLHLIDTGTTGPTHWPSIAHASAELRRPRHLRVVPAATESTASPERAAPPVVRRALLDSRRR